MIPDSGIVILFAACLLFSGFFSGAEVALISINEAKVRTLVDQKKKGSKALEHLKKNTDHLLITILVGNNLVNIGAASLATSLAIRYYGDLGVGIATGVVTLLMLIFGEIGPKTYAARIPEKFALVVAGPVLYMSYLLAPFFWLYDWTKRLFSISEKISQPKITEEEIKQWIDVGEEAGTIEEEEHEMLFRVFRFTDTIAREAMTPRADVVMLEDTGSLESSIEIFYETGLSRLPVYHDQRDNIIGVLNVKDVFAAVYSKKTGLNISDLMYEPHFVPESKKIDELLKEMQLRKVHLALVVDEYGTFAGIITIEDMLEELVGEILDEFDEEEPEIQKINENNYIVDARAWVDRLNEELEISLPLDESYETIGGLMIESLGHIPRRNEVTEIRECGIRIKVMTMRGRRLIKLKLILPQKPATGND